MGKKLIGIMVIVIMLFGVFGLTACTESLAHYKAKGKALIDAHVATKTQGDYSTEKWAEILNIAADGKQAVEDATNKSEVDTAVNNAKVVINAVGMGKFYTLQEAYDEGWLTIQDLMSIAYYHGTLGGVDGTFIPTPKDPENLSEEVVAKIKEVYISILLLKTYPDGTLLFPNATIDCIDIEWYYGTYNNAVALKITDEYTEYGASIEEMTVAGITFSYSGAPITIYYKSK